MIGAPAGTADYADPHTGRTTAWEYATWTSPVHRLAVPSTEVIASWNAHTPSGTWLQVELKGTYSDGTDTPWYVMGRWAAGDGDQDIPAHLGRRPGRRQEQCLDGHVRRRRRLDGAAPGLLPAQAHPLPPPRHEEHAHRMAARRDGLRRPRPLHRPPPPPPGLAQELRVPRYSQEIHKGQYPEYDNGGEAWCSPTSSQMIIEYWGGRLTEEQLAWVDPSYADPQVCHAARYTYDYQYAGCGNWPFNAAYAATFKGLQGVVPRLGSLTDLETLIAAGIPAITSQSFLEEGADGGRVRHVGAPDDRDRLHRRRRR